jgi:shikimate kinase
VPLPLNIALIGFMGSGKSTVGRALARQLGWRYVDTDARLVDVAGCDIPTLFAREGETAFREREARIILGISAGTEQVIATGGGAVLRDENVAALRSCGAVIYLTARPDVIVARTERRAEERPLLANRGDRDLLTHVLALLGERAPRYHAVAHLIVDTSDRTPDLIAAEIVRRTEAKWSIPEAAESKE